METVFTIIGVVTVGWWITKFAMLPLKEEYSSADN